MRVLRVSAGLDPRHGGPPHSTLLSALGSRAAGIDVELATIDEGESAAPAVARLRDAGVPVHVFPRSRVPGARRFSVSWPLARWVNERAPQFDVVHIHGAWTATSFAALVAAKVHRVPVVLTPHESVTEHDLGTSGTVMRAVKRAVRRIYFAALDGAVFASQLELDDSGVRVSARHVVIPHPVEPGAARARSAPNGSLRVGFLGRFDPKKNLDVLLRALPEHAELLVGGDGPPEMRASVRAVASAAGVAERVRWLGFVEEGAKARFFDDVDLLVMPSRYECYGMVAAEALAAGVPVVVSPATGIAPFVRRHQCGFVVEPDERSLRDVLTRPDDLGAKGVRARAAADAELGLERHGRALVDLYRQLTGGRR